MPVNCAAEMRKCPPSICSSSKGNVMQKAKVGCHKTRIRAPIAISLFYQVALCLNVLHHNQNADCDKRTAWSALIGVLYVQTLNACPVFFFFFRNGSPKRGLRETLLIQMVSQMFVVLEHVGAHLEKEEGWSRDSIIFNFSTSLLRAKYLLHIAELRKLWPGKTTLELLKNIIQSPISH